MKFHVLGHKRASSKLYICVNCSCNNTLSLCEAGHLESQGIYLTFI